MDKDTNSNKIWLVRHAHSYFNMWDDWHEGRLKSTELTELELSFVSSIADKFDIKLVDPILSHSGTSQAISMQPFINTLPIQCVLVSPIQRTLETAKLLFESHPNKNNIKFIVVPLIREIMANPDDIPSFTLDRMKPKYKEFNFQAIENSRDKNLYFLETMDKTIQERIMAEVAVEGEDNYLEIMTKVMKEMWVTQSIHKKKIESFENGRKRCHAFAKWIKEDFIKQKGVKSENVMVVSHSVFLSHLIAQKFNDYGKAVCSKIPNAVPFLFDLDTVIPF